MKIIITGIIALMFLVPMLAHAQQLTSEQSTKLQTFIGQLKQEQQNHSGTADNSICQRQLLYLQTKSLLAGITQNGTYVNSLPENVRDWRQLVSN